MAEISDQAASTLAEAMTRLLTEREAVPDELELLRSGDLSNREVALALIGRRPDGPLPRPGTAERRQYFAAMRSVQRYRAAPGRRERRLIRYVSHHSTSSEQPKLGRNHIPCALGRVATAVRKLRVRQGMWAAGRDRHHMV